MNDAYLMHGRSIGYPAPMNLRIAEGFDGYNPVALSIVRHFPSLVSYMAKLKSDQYAGSLSDLPKNTTGVKMDRGCATKLSHLPSELLTLSMDAWDDYYLETPEFPAEYKLPRLEALEMLDPPYNLLPFLPSSLQWLHLNSDSQPLMDITRLSNDGVLCNLHTLQISHFHGNYELRLSTLTIPNRLTTLKLNCRIAFSSLDETSFTHLTNLKHLNLKRSTKPLALFRNLPPSLTRLTARLSSSFYLSEVEDAVELSCFKDRVPKLKSLIIPDAFIHPLDSHYFPSMSLSDWYSLPPLVRRMYAEATLGLLNSRMASEKFLLACLPRELSELRIRRYDIVGSLADSTWFTFLWDTIFIPACMYQVPLLGLHITNPLENPFDYRRKEEAILRPVVPPHLSTVCTLDDGPNGFLQSPYFHASNGRWMNGNKYKRRRWPSPVDCALHFSNIIMLLLMPMIVPQTWSTMSWLRIYFWTTMLGSAIGLPLSIRRYQRARSMEHAASVHPPSWIEFALRIALGVLGSFISGLLIGLTALTWTGDYELVFCVLVLLVILCYSCARNYILTRA